MTTYDFKSSERKKYQTWIDMGDLLADVVAATASCLHAGYS